MNEIDCAEKEVVQKTSCEEYLLCTGLQLPADKECSKSTKDALMNEHEKIKDWCKKAFQ